MIVSDLTLAFLEDTNQYIANYSLAGTLLPDIPDNLILSSLTVFQKNPSVGIDSAVSNVLGVSVL